MDQNKINQYYQKQANARKQVEILRELYPKAKHDLERGRLAQKDLLITYTEWQELTKLLYVFPDGNFHIR